MNAVLVRVKFLLYDWLGLLSFLACVAVAHSVRQLSETKDVIVVSGATFGVIVGLMNRRSDDLRAFRELFRESNARYEKLARYLDAVSQKSAGVLTTEERAACASYIDLCAEEFLFFSQGLVHPQAWSAWKKGMAWQFDRIPELRRLATENSESLYGFKGSWSRMKET